MSTWLIVLIVIGVVLAVGSVVYVVYRWGKKSTATKIALSGASAILNVLESLFKDDPDKVDAHDFMAVFGKLTDVCLITLKEVEAGKPIEDLKESMGLSIRGIVDEFPGMKEKVSDDIISKSVSAFFTLISNIPKVNDIVKK